MVNLHAIWEAFGATCLEDEDQLKSCNFKVMMILLITDEHCDNKVMMVLLMLDEPCDNKVMMIRRLTDEHCEKRYTTLSSRVTLHVDEHWL